jgi:antitoxin VapB
MYIPLTYPQKTLLFGLIAFAETTEAKMEQTTLFMSNRSQAVRLPKAVAMPSDVKRVNVVAIGRTRIITPADETWDSWFDGDSASADFMADRDQPTDQERESL